MSNLLLEEVIDFSTVWAEAQNWLNWLYGILGGTGVASIIAIAYKIYKKIKETKASIENNTGNLEATIKEAVSKSLPDSLTIDVEAISKEAFNNLCDKLEAKFEENFEKTKENEKLLKALGTAICCLKSVPESVKEEIASQIKNEITETESKIKVQLIPSVSDLKVENKKEEQEYIE